MKLFQQMLVAGVAVSLVTPLASQAADMNFEGINSYSRSSKKKKAKRFDSNTFINKVDKEFANTQQKAQQNIFEAGAFSETTTMGGSAVFAATQIKNANDVNSSASESFQTMYTYTLDLNTSFTGDDNLYARLRAGNGKVSNGSFYEKTAFYHTDTYSGNKIDALAVDKLWYEFPIGNSEQFTGFVGPKIENYYMYAAPVSIYRPGFHKAFKLGSLSGAFGASTAMGAGVKYTADNGFAASTNIVSKGAKSASGLYTDEDASKWDTMLAYTQDQYHLSLTVSRQHNKWNSYSYYATDAVSGKIDADTNATAYALRAYWRPEETGSFIPDVSFGYDVLTLEGQAGAAKVKEAKSYFVGLGWHDIFQDSDYIGFGFGQPLTTTGTVNGDDNVDAELDPMMWELSYSFKVNDSITMIPAVFGGYDIQSWTDEDYFGAALTTKFKF